MPSTGTNTFDLDLLEVIEEAWERATKREIRTGYELRTARRSLNLLFIEWQNRGLNLWTLDEEVLPLVAGTANYTLPASTVDVIDGSIRTNTGQQQQDMFISRMSIAEYLRLTNKNLQGAPTRYAVDRQVNAPVVWFWQVPDSASYAFVYWRMRRIYDAGTNTETQDVPFRFMPAMTAGLAWYIAQKVPGVPLDERIALEKAYSDQYMMAEWEDRDRSTMRVVPAT